MEAIRDELLRFWFGASGDDAETAAAQAGLWWGKDPDTDDEIGARFGVLATAGAAGTLDHWRGSPRGRLALILCLDQLPRVIHRGTAAAFAQDAKAREVAARGLASGADRLLRPIERVFFYLPFEHSESADDQQRSVDLFGELAGSVRTEWRETFDGFLDFAVRHKEIIDRFGRFPHRNDALGRESTLEERKYLEDPDAGF
jgi:uncharacterized protein (DUF924 family)